MKKCFSFLLSLALLFALAPQGKAAPDERVIDLTAATLDGKAITEYDYTWHADPAGDHDQVKDSPAEYYTGTKPKGEAVYIAHDIIYTPQIPQEKFQRITYSGDQEWVARYENKAHRNYIFATLPAAGDVFPSHMMHTPQEAYQNPVLHITQSGTYRLKGKWQGQIWVDAGKNGRVTLILDGADITCTVAPAVVFYKVYEPDNVQEEPGASLVLAQGSENTISGGNVFRILKTKYKDTEGFGQDQKKAWKMDGAIHTYQTLRISGEGKLRLEASFEGIATERHLAISGGDIRIRAQDDGINAGEDDVSLIAISGGRVDVQGGLGASGDGIDSNGRLEIHGGQVISAGNPGCDVGLDSANGTYIYGGWVLSMGEAMTQADSGRILETGQPVAILTFAQSQDPGKGLVLEESGVEVFSYREDRAGGRAYPQVILSSPDLQIGKLYQLTVGQEPITVGGKAGEAAEIYLSGPITRISDLRVTNSRLPIEVPPDATPAETTPPQATIPTATTIPTPSEEPWESESSSDTVLVIIVVVVCLAFIGFGLRKKDRR